MNDFDQFGGRKNSRRIFIKIYMAKEVGRCKEQHIPAAAMATAIFVAWLPNSSYL